MSWEAVYVLAALLCVDEDVYKCRYNTPVSIISQLMQCFCHSHIVLLNVKLKKLYSRLV